MSREECDRRPRIALPAASVEDARARLAVSGADEIIFADPPGDLKDLPALPPGPTVELPYREELLPLYKELGPRIRVRVACGMFPSLDDACAALRRLSQEGLASTIEDLDSLGPEEGRRLLDLFLRDPGIGRPIEPFAALLSASIRRRRVGLWDLFPRTEAEARDADEFLLALPREHPECLSCHFFFQCEAYGAWAGSCKTWRAILADLARAAREISRPDRLREGREKGSYR